MFTRKSQFGILNYQFLTYMYCMPNSTDYSAFSEKRNIPLSTFHIKFITQHSLHVYHSNALAHLYLIHRIEEKLAVFGYSHNIAQLRLVIFLADKYL